MYTSLSSQYRVGVTTISKIVPEVCQAIWDTMRTKYVVMPSTEDQWRNIALDFERRWNYPHCVGAIDGKHVVMQCPANSGSVYFNYKGTFSMVLLAICDAQYKFLAVDIGAYGRSSDAGVFSNSSLGKALSPPQFFASTTR